MLGEEFGSHRADVFRLVAIEAGGADEALEFLLRDRGVVLRRAAALEEVARHEILALVECCLQKSFSVDASTRRKSRATHEVLLAFGDISILMCGFVAMIKPRLILVLLSLISIISPSCDSKPQAAPTDQTPTKPATTEQKPAEVVPTEEATATNEQTPSETPSPNEPAQSDESTKTLTILKAIYGTDEANQEVTSLVAEQVKDNRIHLLVVNRTMGGNPAPGQRKRLLVEYELDGERLDLSVPESGCLIIPATTEQLSTKTLTILKAIYGTDEANQEVTSLVAEQVKDNRIHRLVVNRTMGGDTAPGQSKRLLVEYELDGERLDISIPEYVCLTIPASTEELATEPLTSEETPSETAATAEVTEASAEQLKALQGEMNAAMEANDLEKATQLAQEIQKLVAQIKEQKEPSQTPDGPQEAVASPESTPAVAQESEPVAEEPAPVATPEATPDPVFTAQMEKFMEQFEKSKALAVSPIQKRFDFSAQQLLRKVTQSGNLEAAMLLKSIIEDPEALAALPEEANSPQENELLKLLQLRDKQTAVALSPIEKRFELAAQPLIRKATQAGDQESAEKLQALFKKSAPQPSLLTAKSSSSSSSSKTKESPERDFQFSFQGETVTITKYIGDSAKVCVPSKIQGATVTKIGQGAFWDKTKVKEIVLPDTIQVIGNAALWGANNLSQINIPESVTEFLGRDHFSGAKLEKLMIPASVRKIGGPITRWCKELEGIEVDPANPNYTSVGGVLYDKELTTLINIPAGLKDKTLKVPNTVRKIGYRAMQGSQVRTLEVPKDTEIAPDAFYEANCRVVRY